MLYCLEIDVEGGHVKATKVIEAKVVRITVKSNTGRTFIITRYQGGGTVFAD